MRRRQRELDNGEVPVSIWRHIWPRKAEALYCLLRFMMPAATGDGQGEKSASGEGQEPNCKLKSSSASKDVDVKKKPPTPRK